MDVYFPASASSERTKSVVRRIADASAMLIWMLDADHVCTYLNPSSAALFAADDKVDLSAWLEFIHPDDRPRVFPILRGAIDAREEYQFRYRIVRSDGSIRWMMGSGAPRFSPGGEYLGYIGNEIDVSDQQQALMVIEKSEATHRLLIENSSDVIAHHAIDGTILHVSPSITRILGYTPAELVGRKVLETVHPDDIAVIVADIQRQLRGDGDSHVIEIRKRHKQGHDVWFSSKMRVLVDPVTGEGTGVITVCRDVTFERQAREELKDREERFRSLTGLSSDWYWETDTEDRISFMSDSATRVFGVPPAHYIGLSRLAAAHDPSEPGMRQYMQAVAARRPFRDLRYATVAGPGARPRCVSISGQPMYRNGEFAGYRGIGRDVTEEVEVARHMARLADENRALVENSLDIIALLDEQGCFLRVNEAVAEILGYRPQEWIGRHYTEFLHPDDWNVTQAADAGLRTASNTIRDFQTRWRRKDGGIAHLALSVRWASDKKMMYATARDVTERRRVQDELQRSKDQLSTILESMGEAFFALDGEWRITYANRKTLDFVGVGSAQDALGRQVWDVVPSIRDSRLFAHYQAVMRSRAPRSVDAYWEASGAWVEVRIYPQGDGIAVYFHNVSDRREAERAVRDSEQRFREIIEMTPAGYILADGNAVMLDVNPALCALTGYGKEELVGQPLEKLFSSCPWHGALAVQHGPDSARGMEAAVRHKSNRDIHVLFSGSIKRDADGHAQAFTAFLTDITERKQAENRLEELATHDVLTGLPNRVLVNRRLQAMLDTAARDDEIAVMFIDLDRFKEVNDSMGHAPGDILLREVAMRLKKCMRPGDIVARLGGDEFVVAAHCSDGRQSAAAIAQKLLAMLAEPFTINGQEVFVGASIGISMFAEDAGSTELLFQNADTAMYRAKDAGRSTYRFFESEMSAETKRRVMIEQSLRHALERGEFSLHYQPRVRLDTLAFIGVEALLRWQHPQLGPISPAEFIPLAEDRGYITGIGNWVLHEATRQTRQLCDKFGRRIQVSVNLSAHQLKCADLVEQVSSALAGSRLAPELLELELTESALIENVDQSVHMLKRLKRLGLLLSVDDFGTGYSALSYLKRFPVDILKLDRSFVHQQPEGISSVEFIKAFVDMAHALRLSVVAEGIETAEILDLLKDVRCDEGQGYLFARPMAPDDLERYIAGL